MEWYNVVVKQEALKNLYCEEAELTKWRQAPQTAPSLVPRLLPNPHRWETTICTHGCIFKRWHYL